ncbi:type I secretion system permease/ATPase [Vibrio ouci]|uniref:Type I secretion system permease/ATPase n=1 Tax=Vibrio ouci TaxID=2499078 RepID=A0A4Y8WIB4_9VIBR|nr:type I secretion system permease/ATPase [Vibrio ouci]TFH92423.1 type I secretion system permease/ATPase [Vibrio ouci]
MENEYRDDPWLTTLEWLGDHFKSRCHRTHLINGLPLKNGSFDRSLFLRGLEKLSLQIQMVKKTAIDQTIVPLVAMDMKSGEPILIISVEQGGVRGIRQGEEFSAPSSSFLSTIESNVWQISMPAKLDSRVDVVADKKPSHWLWRTVREVKPWYRDLLVASLMINVLALVVPLFTMNVYDRVVPNQAFSTLWVLAIGVAVVVVFDWLLREARSSVTDAAGRYIDNKLSATLFSKVLGMKLEQRPQSVGAFSRQMQEFDSVRDFFTSVTLTTLVDLPFTLLFLLLIGWLGGPLMFIPVSVMLLLIVFSMVMKDKVEGTHVETARLSTQKQAHLFDGLTNIDEIKQNNAQGMMQQRWEQLSSALSDWQIRSRHYSNLIAHTIQSSQQVVTIGLIVLGVYQISEGLLSMGGLIAIVMLSGRAAGSINQLSMLLLRYQQTKTAVDSLTSIIELEQEDQNSSLLSDGEFQGAIKLDAISYQYPETPTICLDEIDLTIAKGQRVGVIGSVGAGKSTLLSIIAKQLNPTGGRIFYDEIDSQLWPNSLLRSKTGWVGQSTQLLFGSVVENITLGHGDVDQDKLTQAVNLSGLNAYMDRFNNGLETQVGEGGRFLSGGQRQTVALARALYRDSSLIILDEPTSSLDKQSETRLFNSLQSLPRSKTLIISSHKPSFLALCDRIIVMDRGKVIADGTPAEVFNQTNNKTAKSRVRSVSVVRGGHNE